ncbi:hypothetical protein [Rhodococcus triatomae]
MTVWSGYVPWIVIAILFASWSSTRYRRPGRAVLIGFAALMLAVVASAVAFVFFQTPAGSRFWPYAPWMLVVAVAAWWSYTRHRRPGRAVLTGLGALVFVPSLLLVLALLQTQVVRR